LKALKIAWTYLWRELLRGQSEQNEEQAMLSQHEGSTFIRAEAVVGVLDKVIAKYSEAHSSANEWEEEHLKAGAAVAALEQMKSWLVGQINSQKKGLT
jgi:hypothetical protein